MTAYECYLWYAEAQLKKSANSLMPKIVIPKII